MALLVMGIYLPRQDTDPRPALARRLGVPEDELLVVETVRVSLDSRHRKPRIVVNLRVELRGDEEALLAGKPSGVRRFTERDAQRAGKGTIGERRRRWRCSVRPLVVGAGPAGLFAALKLAEAGGEPLLLERGDPVERRKGRVAAYWRTGELDPECNVMFGEGGAGAFSDGKLHTRLRDGRVGYVLQRLADLGADPAILRQAHPHLGTDGLRRILVAMRQRLEALGVQLRFRTCVRSLLRDEGRCLGVELADGSFLRGGPVVLATGHSARDSLQAQLDAGMQAETRPMAVGLRIEHPRTLIAQGLHGEHARSHAGASYRMAWGSSARRGAYTFCMCPGGLVIPVSNHQGRVVLNGMSFSKRGSRWSNAAIVVPVTPEDYPGDGPMAGFRYQDSLERRAWDVAGGRYRAPAQRASDFLAGRASRDLPRVSHPLGAEACDLRQVLPAPLLPELAAALMAFDKKIPGYAGPQAVLLAPESRTTCPLRLLRQADRSACGLEGAYPVGEGAGWAGGIVSAAVDGVKTAEAIIARYAEE